MLKHIRICMCFLVLNALVSIASYYLIINPRDDPRHVKLFYTIIEYGNIQSLIGFLIGYVTTRWIYINDELYVSDV